MHRTEINLQTGEHIVIDLTPEEIAKNQIWQAEEDAKQQAAIDAKASALAKLAALGLTQDEVKALVG